MGKHANISVFVPHLGCPRQCSFCDQRAITGEERAELPGKADVLAAAERAAQTMEDPERRRQTELAFFGGSFTAIDRSYMLELLETASAVVAEYGFKGVRCSTRPDAIDQEVLDLLKVHRVTAIELGAQSMDNGVLAANFRGHTAEDTAQAAGLIRGMGFELGVQMMTGLYTDTDEKALATAEKLVDLKPATVRVYPTVVLPGTQLARLWDRGEYHPQTLEQAVELCAELLGRFRRAGMRVIRMGLHPSPELERKRLDGPYHPAFRQLVESRMFLRGLLGELEVLGQGEYTVEVCPRDISTALGQGRGNLRQLEERGFSVRFTQESSVEPGGWRIVE